MEQQQQPQRQESTLIRDDDRRTSSSSLSSTNNVEIDGKFFRKSKIGKLKQVVPVNGSSCDSMQANSNEKIALKLIFDKYAIPILSPKFMGPEQLQNYFKNENYANDYKSLSMCRKIIMDLEGGDSDRLKFEGFERMLACDEYNIFNTLHLKRCQSLNKSLAHYFVATSTMIRYPDDEDEERRLIKIYDLHMCQNRTADGSSSSSSCSSDQEKAILGKYRDLLNQCRCFELTATWNKESKNVSVLIAGKSGKTIDINLQRLLLFFRDNAFTVENFDDHDNDDDDSSQPKEPNHLPIIFNIDCGDLVQNKKMNELIQIVEATFHDIQLYDPDKLGINSLSTNCLNFWNSGSELPTLKSLMKKFVIIFRNHPSDKQCSVGKFYREQTEQNDWNKIMKAESNKFKVLKQLEIDPLRSVVSIDESKFLYLMEKYAEKTMEDYWPRLTHRVFTTLHHYDGNYPEAAATKVPSMIRVGVQAIPITEDNVNQSNEASLIDHQCARALFELNGQCGYVLKPKSLRKGRLYCIGFTEEKPMKNEPPYGPSRFRLKILSAENLMKFDRQNPMRTQVLVRICGHKEDNGKFETKICSRNGQCPSWDEEFRPILRLPNFVFVYFQVKNDGKLIGHRMYSLKSMLKGIRFVQLLDPSTGELLEKAKLFVHANCKKIADSWSPCSDDFDPLENSDDDDSDSENEEDS